MFRIAALTVVAAALAPVSGFAPVARSSTTFALSEHGPHENWEPSQVDLEPTWESYPRPEPLRKAEAVYDGEVDFDAPIDPTKVTMGSIGASAVEMAGAPVVDDECYLGKEAQMDDCVDFDPPSSDYTEAEFIPAPPARETDSNDFLMPDFSSLAKDIAEQLKMARSSLEKLIKK